MPSSFRPPVVAVMGHIDHGKTTLLDRIRSSHLADREAGGITQAISAYQAEGITFIDTPGHAAFFRMRSRGAQITDIVVLVISAVDGIMAQTKECLEHIKNANLPVIVAINKIDLPGANPDKVKGQLVELGLTPEDYGGQVPCLLLSAKTGQGVDKLLDQIRLHAEVMELKADPDSSPEVFIIESRLDKNSGPVATVIVRQGTLHPGDSLYLGDSAVKIKAVADSSGRPLSAAGPSTPVQLLGFSSLPPVGAILSSQPQAPVPVEPTASAKTPSEAQLPVVLRCDTQGSLEALLGSFSDDVIVISSGTGPVTDNDIFLAENAKAQIFAFNVPLIKSVKNLAENNKVPIFQSKIIYEIIENIQSQVLKILEPTIDETILGEATIKAEFKIDKTRIAGISCYKGEIAKGSAIHLKRDGKIIKDTRIDSLHQAKLAVDKIKSGQEAGLTFKPYVDFKLNDVIISYYKT